jgi:hypothetical protein
MIFLQNECSAVVTWPPEVDGRGLKVQHFRLENTITADSSLVAQQKQTILSLVMYISCSSSKKTGIMRDHCFRSKLKMATSTGSSSYSTTETDITAVPKPIPRFSGSLVKRTPTRLSRDINFRSNSKYVELYSQYATSAHD